MSIPKNKVSKKQTQHELNEAMAWIAQGVVNIDSGIVAPIEKGSYVYLGMLKLCELVSERRVGVLKP